MDKITAERFWAKVNKHGRMASPYLGPCWEWTAALSKPGYGYFHGFRVARNG